MPRSNEVVQALLQEYADLLAISGGDPFRVRTYEKAARSIGGYHAEVSSLDQKGLEAIPSVGKSTAGKVEEALRTGTFAALEDLRAAVPSGVRQMMAISGLGPKKAMLLYRDLGISSVAELAAAIDAGRLKGLRGFGDRTEENILRGIALVQESGARVQINVAMELAEDVIGRLGALKETRQIAYAGSLRRMAETIGDVDILVAATKPAPVMEAFASLPNVERVIARGETKTSIRTIQGLQVDLRLALILQQPAELFLLLLAA